MKICKLKINGLALGGIAGLIMGKLRESDVVVFKIDEFQNFILFAVSGEPASVTHTYVIIYDVIDKKDKRHLRDVYLDVATAPSDPKVTDNLRLWKKFS